jgi:hypothetical protein
VGEDVLIDTAPCHLTFSESDGVRIAALYLPSLSSASTSQQSILTDERPYGMVGKA